MLKSLLTVGLLSALAVQYLGGPVLTLAASSPAVLDRVLELPGKNKPVNMALRGVSLQNAFRALARKGGFNVVVDESVEGDVTLDLYNVSIANALQTLRNYGSLSYGFNNNTLIVAHASSDKGKTFKRNATKIIRLKHANAKLVADVLNRSVFYDPRTAVQDSSGGASQQGGQKATPDFNSNSLIVVGSQSDISLAEEFSEMLDKPRAMRTWRLSHADAIDVATIFSSSIFNDGVIPAIMLQQTGGGSGGGTSGGGTSGGGGGATAGGGASNIDPADLGAGILSATSLGRSQVVEAAEEDAETGGEITIRAYVKADEQISVNALGVILLPDSRLNTLTILGTEKQIELAEQLMPVVDRKVPQVVLETSIIELTEGASKEFGTAIAATGDGKAGLSFNSAGQGNTVFDFTSNPLVSASDLGIELRALMTKNKAKILSNPTIIAAHDTQAIINIVDEVIQGTQVVQDVNSNVAAEVPIFGQAGISLTIIPKIGANGNITLRVNPTLAFPQPDVFNDGVTLISSRELFAQEVIMRDGQSFILGGLIQDSDSQTLNKIPGLADLPILGALARSSRNTKNRSEILVVVTPHILNDSGTTTQRQLATSGAPVVVDQEKLMRSSSKAGRPDPSVLPALQPVNVLSTNKTVGTTRLLSKPDQNWVDSVVDLTQPTRVAPQAKVTSNPTMSLRDSGVPQSQVTQPVAAKTNQSGSPSVDDLVDSIMQDFEP